MGAFTDSSMKVMLDVIARVYAVSATGATRVTIGGRKEFRRNFDLFESESMMIQASRLVQRMDEGYVSTPFPLTLITPASYWRESLNSFLSRLELNSRIDRVRGDQFETEVRIVVRDKVVSSAVGTNRSTAAEKACKIALQNLIAVQAAMTGTADMIECYAGRIGRQKLIKGLPKELHEYFEKLPCA
jgi:hypothetical protein